MVASVPDRVRRPGLASGDAAADGRTVAAWSSLEAGCLTGWSKVDLDGLAEALLRAVCPAAGPLLVQDAPVRAAAAGE